VNERWQNDPRMGTNGSDRARLRGIARRAMVETGLQPDFSAAAQAEAAAITAPARDPALRDERAFSWFSIDNDDSRDLDQLSVAEPLTGGVVRIRLAIADVDGLVRKGSAIDGHARANTTSVYTPAQIFPMLPEKLSTDLTSLNPDEDRQAVVIAFEVGPDGAIGSPEVYQALVRNHAKLAYPSVAAWLEGKGPLPEPAKLPGIDAQLRLQDGAAQALRARRHENGALDLDTIEAKAEFSGDELQALHDRRQDRAEELIEDLMVAGNGVTARFLAGKKFPSLRRVVREPARWARIVELAREHGDALPADPDAPALERFLVERRRADPVRFPDLSLSVIKLLGSGEYTVERAGQSPEGHFGLAVRDYTHSTAPNRRFPDLITQRLLKAALDGGRPPYSDEEMEALAAHCTEQEDAAKKVERRVRKAAAALMLARREGDTFNGIVTGASEKGTWVRIFDPPAEGKVVRGEAGMDVGERVRVRLVDTDPERGYIDFARA
jgi:VacB/RNase II family 3'-5' exoribonuclease